MSSRVSHSKAQAAWRAQLKHFTWGQCFLINGPMTSNEWTNEMLNSAWQRNDTFWGAHLFWITLARYGACWKQKSASSISRHTHSKSEHTRGHTHSQSDHNLIVLACYRLWITLGKYAQIHTPTERERERESFQKKRAPGVWIFQADT